MFKKDHNGIEEQFEQILSLNMLDLQTALQNRRFTAVTVAYAYIERAIQINEHLNCITEMIEDVIGWANQMDEKAAEYTEEENIFMKKYPLYGLPFSIKSNFHVSGHAATLGLSKLLATNQATDCTIVRRLKEKGAIPICLTNVPQGLLAYVTSNPLYGTTKNPWDLSRTPGGSSGGEAALVSAGGVAFGIGNDLVGSLRIPAAFCGLVTLKPCEDRIDPKGEMHAGPSQIGKLGLSSGFFTRTVEEQKFLLHHTYPRDTVSGNTTLEKRTWKIAYFDDDGFNPVVESSKRAVKIVKTELEKKFGIIEEFKLKTLGFPPEQIAKMLFKNVMPDNGSSMHALYDDEPQDKNIKFFIWLLRCKKSATANWIANKLILLIEWFSQRGAWLVQACNRNQDDRNTNNRKTDELRANWEEKLKEIDAIICPAFITPAQPFEYPAKLATGTFCTGLFNMLDVPAGIVPVSYVTEKENDTLTKAGDMILDWQNKAAFGSDGLPIAVQVVTKRGDEEICLEIMQLIQLALQNHLKKLRFKLGEMEATGNGGKQNDSLFERVSLIEEPDVNAAPASNRNDRDENAPSTSAQHDRDNNTPSTSNRNDCYEGTPSTSNQYKHYDNASTSNNEDPEETTVTRL